MISQLCYHLCYLKIRKSNNLLILTKKTWPSFCKAHEPEGIHIFNQKLLRGNTAGWLKKMFGKNGGCMGLFQNMSEKNNAISSYQDDSNPLLNGKIRDAL